MAQAAHSQSLCTMNWVKPVVGVTPAAGEACQTARGSLRDLPSQQMMADHVRPARASSYPNWNKRLHSQHNAQKSLDDFCKRIGQQAEADVARSRC